MEISLKDVFDRYGPMLGLILTFVVLVTVLPSNTDGGGGGEVDATAQAGQPLTGTGAQGGIGTGAQGATGTGSSGSVAAGSTGAAGAPGASGGAAPGLPSNDPGAAAAVTDGKYPCRPDGRQAAISVIAPPCQQYDGNNGGSTAPGVTATEIKVAYYVPRADAATEAALKAAGVGDEQPDVDRIMEVYRQYMNDHTQTYGREIVFRKYDASGPLGDEVAARADAKRIIEDGNFAVITARGTTASPTFDRTVAHGGVICVACNSTQAKSFYDDTKGYMFGSLPAAREYYEHLAEYMAKRLLGGNRTAKWAGAPASPADVDLRAQPRKFGLIWVNSVQGTVDPGTQEERDNFINNILPRYGITGVIDSSYDYDLTKAPATAQTIIAKMNTSHVTTIICICDALSPVFFTREATKQAYFPEWLQAGTGLTDTTFFGRTYDSQQWGRSFGISPLWVFWERVANSEGYREYHHQCPFTGLPEGECADGKEGVGVNTYRAGFLYLEIGISGAGPNLTAEAFANGLYSFPYTGGIPHVPLIGWTPDSPNAIKDFTEVFWDPNRSGPDEVDTQGQGVLMKAEGGKRYQLGQWPTHDPKVLAEGEGGVHVSDEPYTNPATRRIHEEDGHTHTEGGCLSCG